MNNVEAAYKFETLCSKVEYCTRCPRMDESARILSRAAGPLGARLMFIGEAPGRLGADESGVPFHGDVAGHNFEELLSFAGIARDEVFITNAVLCNPRDTAGNNATPDASEVSNCSAYLREQFSLVEPELVVTLGATALNALSLIQSHGLNLATHVRTANPWYGRQLIPLYHPGQRAMIHRSMANQRSDYQFVAEQLSRLTAPARGGAGRAKTDVARLVRAIHGRLPSISYFGLHKVLYLAECEAWRALGHPLTRAFFLRQKDGPYCTDAHIGRLKRAISDLHVTSDRGVLRLNLRGEGLFSQPGEPLDGDLQAVVDSVVAAVRGLTDAQLKTKVYLSAPMRAILRAEKTRLINLYNAPISFAPLKRTPVDDVAAA